MPGRVAKHFSVLSVLQTNQTSHSIYRLGLRFLHGHSLRAVGGRRGMPLQLLQECCCSPEIPAAISHIKAFSIRGVGTLRLVALVQDLVEAQNVRKLTVCIPAEKLESTLITRVVQFTTFFNPTISLKSHAKVSL